MSRPRRRRAPRIPTFGLSTGGTDADERFKPLVDAYAHNLFVGSDFRKLESRHMRAIDHVDLAAIADHLAGWQPGLGLGLGVSLCLYGPPGTGKTEYCRYLAHRMGRRVVYRRVSDLQSMWVGECEKNIAEAFREAREEDALLLFDEADTWLRDRRDAQRSWELSQTNEFLAQLERCRSVVACTTNLRHHLDPASLRRFIFKIEFRFMLPEQSAALFTELLPVAHGHGVDAVLLAELLLHSRREILVNE